MAILKTYDLKGNKLSFANWISNLSPTETPFASMIGKEAVDQVMYQWQTDRLSSPKNDGVKEGAEFAGTLLSPTQVHSNFTQILRKVVRITDTANQVGLYGRDSEKAYQMEMRSRELKRDLERAMLTQTTGTIGAKGTAARKMKGFPGLVAPLGLPCPDTGAVVHKMFESAIAGPSFGEDEIFDMTYNLYLAGSKANKIMCHPIHMAVFSDFMNKNQHGYVHRMFENLDAKFNAYVGKLRDPLGQEFDIIPNRFMPQEAIYFFNEADWTQMILREPKTVELAKNGSSEKHMIEMEVGLRHRNPFASGILELKTSGGVDKTEIVARFTHPDIYVKDAAGVTPKATKLEIVEYKNGQINTTASGAFTLAASPTAGITVPAAAGNWSNGKFTVTADFEGTAAGVYTVTVSKTNGPVTSLNLNIHSADLRSAPLSDEALEEASAVVAKKARKAKAE